MHIELTDLRQFSPLRDYFLRLGASVASEDDGTLDVAFREGLLNDDESAELCFESWVRANRVDARVVESNPPPAPFDLAPQPPRLGELLSRKGYITEEQLVQALRESYQSGDILGRVLIRNGWVFESELARVLAEQWSLPYINVAIVGVDPYALKLMTPELGRRCSAVPVCVVGDELRVAFADPTDPATVAQVQDQIDFPIQVVISDLSGIDAIWESVVRGTRGLVRR